MRQASQRLEGIKGLSAEEIEGQSAPVDSPAKKMKSVRKVAAPDEVAKALRSAYNEALRESVPDDFLDLLGKLS